ncbi:helix-turn-helix transcriptional regulator [Nocardioides sp. GY 10113]|uniref:winged helix-turn-helix transcriptional regulator n=1 Tax=Nocardioides sp. GY 10113 TaxID=2569761 RepID=UPI0010A8913B|nr:helix-turn-helix domain-containing protein [Nocardioides sp. GY 10113]TIC88455.1 helix-turn-helix transcriptional regulator [Nocardioides sp. GY 10113]
MTSRTQAAPGPVVGEATAPAPDVRSCDGALSRAFQFLGKRWNGMLISVLGGGPAGFAELKRVLGISDSVLSDRLAELTGAGLVQRTVDAGPPVTVAYALTDAGQALLPALHALGDWARDNLDEAICARHG